ARVASALGGRASGLPLDRGARREELAHIALVLRRDARGELGVLGALPARAGVEGDALNAAVEIDAAAAALAHELDGQRQLVAAAGALEHLVHAHQVRGLRAALVLQHAARGALLRRPRGLRPPRTARLVFVLIATLAVLAIAHRCSGSCRAEARGASSRAEAGRTRPAVSQDTGVSSLGNSARCFPPTAGSEWVPWPRV